MPGYCFLTKRTKSSAALGEWLNLTEPFFFFFCQIQSSSMAVMELKPIIKLKAFLMLPFPLAQ